MSSASSTESCRYSKYFDNNGFLRDTLLGTTLPTKCMTPCRSMKSAGRTPAANGALKSPSAALSNGREYQRAAMNQNGTSGIAMSDTPPICPKALPEWHRPETLTQQCWAATAGWKSVVCAKPRNERAGPALLPGRCRRAVEQAIIKRSATYILLAMATGTVKPAYLHRPDVPPPIPVAAFQTRSVRG